MLINRAFGTGTALDEYFAAFRVPDLLFNLLAGVPLELLSDGVVEKFFTGLKPERGGGYADFQMLPNVEYALQIDGQVPPLAAVSAPQCNAGSANAFSGYLLVRWQRRP